MRPFARQKERGAITAFALIFSGVLILAAAFTLVVGQIVKERKQLAQAADMAAASSALHSAAGLNMVSINNLGIAGMIHFSASLHFWARYQSIIAGLLSKTLDEFDATQLEFALNSSAEPLLNNVDKSSRYSKGYRWVDKIMSVVLMNASGLSSLNQQIEKHWFVDSRRIAIQTARVNAPGALVHAKFGEATPPLVLEELTEIARSTESPQLFQKAKNDATWCSSIRASEGLDDRNVATFWLRGFAASLSVEASFLELGEDVEKAIRGVLEAIDKIVSGPLRTLKIAVDALPVGAICSEIPVCKEFYKLLKVITDLSNALKIPTFEHCGINQGGAHDRQLKNFHETRSSERQEEQALGFSFFDLRSKADVEKFRERWTSSVIVARPHLLGRQFFANSKGAKKKCPSMWAYKGEADCLVDPFDAIGVWWREDDHSPALHRARSRAEVYYDAEGDDPTGADMTLLLQQEMTEENVASWKVRAKKSLFWPAWKGNLVYKPDPAELIPEGL